MKSISILVAVGLLAAGAVARAQQLDLSTVKCADFVTSDKQTIGLILMWLEGYYNEDETKAIVDFDQMQKNGEKLGAYCGTNPGHSLITAAEQVMGK